jgi:hypothetical protein
MASIKNAIVGNRMSGLPGVDSWTSAGISKLEKEPPKSLTVRRVIKVGENNELLETLSLSYDRLKDSLRTYPLGVNPMVAVQFQTNSSTQTSLPYKLSSAFRPPIMPLEQTLPLSRQHRKTVEISINSVVPSSAEPFYFHRPLKETMVVDGGQLAASPRGYRSVNTPGYRITAPDRVQPPERPRLETKRILFENPRIVVVEENPLRISQTTNKKSTRVAVPAIGSEVFLQKQPLSSAATAPKSSRAGVVRTEPKNFKMANPLKIPEYSVEAKKPPKDNMNRNEHPRMKTAMRTETRGELEIEHEQQIRAEPSLEAKMSIISVETAKKGAHIPLPNNLPLSTSATTDRAVSFQNFLHNR